MSGRDRWFALALRAYPRRYRTEREDEIMATLVESAEAAGMALDGDGRARPDGPRGTNADRTER